MSMVSPVVQAFDENILYGATITSTVAPDSSYALATLGTLRPDARVVFGNGTVTIHFTLAAAAAGAVLVVPASNIKDTHLHLTNNSLSGLNVNIPVPADQRNGLPRTIVADLTKLATPAQLYASRWDLVVNANPVNLIMGGAVAIYSPLTYLVDRSFLWGDKTKKTYGGWEAENEYLTLYQQGTGTCIREAELSAPASAIDAVTLENWFDGCAGRTKPGLLWLDRSVNDALMGIWQQTFERTNQDTDLQEIVLQYRELSKGLPIH